MAYTSNSSLLWESLQAQPGDEKESKPTVIHAALRSHRLPYDTRCIAITKAGRRCKGHAHKESEFCPFHDPAVSSATRRRNASKGGRSHHKLARLPDGYLRKLTSPTAVGDAMDRLYRETRLGIITPEMARVLFSILMRILEAGFFVGDVAKHQPARQTKAHRIAPKMEDLLTRAERRAWAQAVAKAPTHLGSEQAARPATSEARRKPKRGARRILVPQPQLPLPEVH